MLGSPVILRWRSQEIVRRLRDFQSSGGSRLGKITTEVDVMASLEKKAEGLSVDSSASPPAENKANTDKVEDTHDNLATAVAVPPPQISKLSKPVNLTPDTFYHNLLICW